MYAAAVAPAKASPGKAKEPAGSQSPLAPSLPAHVVMDGRLLDDCLVSSWHTGIWCFPGLLPCLSSSRSLSTRFYVHLAAPGDVLPQTDANMLLAVMACSTCTASERSMLCAAPICSRHPLCVHPAAAW